MLESILNEAFISAYTHLYQQQPEQKFVSFQKTRTEFEGDMTLVVFPFTKQLHQSPEKIANEIGQQMLLENALIKRFNVVKGFLNLLMDDSYWIDFYNQNLENLTFGKATAPKNEHIVIEYSSPNTNKPLHLGHIRNNLLGWSVAEILKANGYKVTKVNLVNDRGIHICKSMIAWQKWGKQTPEEADLKGDKLVGAMYVRFDQELKKEIATLVSEGETQEIAAKNAPLMVQAQQMLRKWEANDTETKQLWSTMNGWVYAGFDSTYKKLGVDFDIIYYESETYLLGKAIVFEGLSKNIFIKKPD